jgi:hypothetical protein
MNRQLLVQKTTTEAVDELALDDTVHGTKLR